MPVMIDKKNQWLLCNEYASEPCYGHYGPDAPGIYAIYAFNRFKLYHKKLVYIGSAKRISRRLKNHPVYVGLSRNDIIPQVKATVTKNYLELERKLIQRLRPILNKSFTGRHVSKS